MFLLAIAIEKVHLIVICFVPGFVYLKHKQISSNKSTRSCRQYSVHNYDRLARKYIPYLGQTSAKKYISLFRTERRKIIPCSAAHLGIGHISE